MEMAEVVMNPVRQRIFQYFLLHETGTVKDIKKALPDVPSASLYRHVKILADSSILVVVGENRIRGTVESIYRLNKSALSAGEERQCCADVAAEHLRGVCKIFFRRQCRSRKGYAAVHQLHTAADGREFSDFLSEINEVALKYMKVEAKADSKTRQITLISAPVNEQET